MSQLQIKTTTINDVARLCHEINRLFCTSLGDFSQVAWENAPEWQRESAVNGVMYRLQNPDATPESMHDNWSKEKVADGWVYGKVKDTEAKTHPCLVPYKELPGQQQMKDILFSTLVDNARLILISASKPQNLNASAIAVMKLANRLTDAEWGNLDETLQVDMAVIGLKLIEEWRNPNFTGEDLHEHCVAVWKKAGWSYGEDYNVAQKKHPQILPWGRLYSTERQEYVNIIRIAEPYVEMARSGML